MGTPPPAGWFTSPDDAHLLRWWDGSAWTTFTKPVAPPAEVPAQRVAASLSVDPAIDARIRAASSGEYENTAEALAALQHQGGLLGAFAAVASQAIAPQQTSGTPNENGVQPYGQPGLSTMFGTSSSGNVGSGANVSWQVGPFRGGSDRYDEYDRRRQRNAGPVGTLMLGLILLVVGVFFAAHFTSQNKVHGDESTATGTVVEHRDSVDSDGTAMCSPIASFTVGGSTYKAGSSSSSNHCASVGSAVPVIYTTADPGDGSAHIKDTGLSAWMFWLIPLAGLVVTGFALRALVRMGRSIRELLPFGNR